MPTLVNPYFNFRDNAREAMEFYRSVFGGELTVNTFADFQMSDDPADQEKIMHAQLTTDGGLVLMGADTPASMDLASASNVHVSISGDDDASLRGYYDKLSGSGQVIMPLESAPWGDVFGMCMDGYGVTWLVSIAPSAP